MVRMQQSFVALGLVSLASSWDICSDPSHYNGSNHVSLAVEGVKYTCDQWKADIPSFNPSLQSCSSKMTTSQGSEGNYALSWFALVRDDCCGTGNEVVCDQYMLWNPCKPGVTYSPDNIVAAWKDTATNTDTKCSAGLFYYKLPTFTPSEAECAKTDEDLEGKTLVKRREVLNQMSQACCNASNNDICADHWPTAPQICSEATAFQTSPLIPGWEGATCGDGRQYYFSEMFTATSTSCKEIVGPPENQYPRDALLAQMSEACCGAPGMDVCSQLSASTTTNIAASKETSSTTTRLAASGIPVFLAGLAVF